jgi:hypothetical protein
MHSGLFCTLKYRREIDGSNLQLIIAVETGRNLDESTLFHVSGHDCAAHEAANQLPSGEYRRLGYCVGLTCGGARLAARSSAMICCKHSMPYWVKGANSVNVGFLGLLAPSIAAGDPRSGCRGKSGDRGIA